MTTTDLQLSVVAVPVRLAPDSDAVKATVRRERGSLDDFGLPVPVLTQVQACAERNLQAAIRAEYDQGVTVPCLTDPATWDADGYETSREDVYRAARLCRTACPVFEQCRAYLATEPPVCGVIAGEYVQHESETRPGWDNCKNEWATTPKQRPAAA